MFTVRSLGIFIVILFLAACSGSAAPSVVVSPVAVVKTSTPAGNNEISISQPQAETATSVPAATQPRPTLAANAWMELPVVPAVSETALEIYRRGLELGNDPNAFSKVGDCQTSTDFFLVDFDKPGRYDLGRFDELQTTIDYYEGSFSRQSLAVKDGFNVASVLSALRADPAVCNKGENPLKCEFRLHRPSVALISMETNFNQQSSEKYGNYMRQIVEFSIENGVVPILATKADNQEGDNSINAEIAEIANEYDIPLWNFWAAVHDLPNNGFDMSLNDGFHLSLGKNYYFTDPDNMQRAWPWRNLTALQTLDAVRAGLNK